MPISWKSISISPQNGGNPIFTGYFSVDDTIGQVTAFYDLSLPINTDVLLPETDPQSYPTADKKFPITNNGLNFYSTAIQTFFSLSNNHFNLYFSGSKNLFRLYQNGKTAFTVQCVIASIDGPPSSQVVCFKEGSKILTNKGYKHIQDLRKGDLVKTLKHGYKAIDMIGKSEIYHSALQERIHNQLYKCSQSKYPEIFEPLIITGHHSILVNEFISDEQREKTSKELGDIYITDDKYRLPACVDKRASVYETPGSYTIYHLALENDNYYMNYGIYANGLLVETCSKRYLKELSNMSLIE
jgi:hypothetical protein